jgi:hypothetical protein
MLREIWMAIALAGVSTACAGGEGIDEGPGPLLGSGFDESESEGENESTEDGEIVEPPGRIVWVGEADGDPRIVATLGPAVQAAFPDGEHYAIRIDRAGEALYAQILDRHGQALELVRVARRAAVFEAGGAPRLQLCYPFPDAPAGAEACTDAPCPWVAAWPDLGEGWPDCVELSDQGTAVRVVGALDGVLFGRHLELGVEPTPLFQAPLSAAQSERLDRASRVALDLQSLQGELAGYALACDDCLLLGAWLAGKGLACQADDTEACSNAYWGVSLHAQTCHFMCAD